jgi:hypothetical protein
MRNGSRIQALDTPPFLFTQGHEPSGLCKELQAIQCPESFPSRFPLLWKMETILRGGGGEGGCESPKKLAAQMGYSLSRLV